MPIVKKYPAEIVSVESLSEGIYTIQAKSLEGKFKYSPGQFLHFSLDEYDPGAEWPESRCFSMQSSPDENFIKITYAVKGSFTSKMMGLTVGSIVTLKLPYGDLFTQEHSKINTVFISGGTGITPFLSLFTHSSFADYLSPVLYAGFREQNANIYKKELLEAKLINPTAVFYNKYQDVDGILNIEEILKESDFSTSFFISGPPQMIREFKSYLLSKGISTQQIKTDDWE
jgi:ferredoxin-NADP reductase